MWRSRFCRPSLLSCYGGYDNIYTLVLTKIDTEVLSCDSCVNGFDLGIQPPSNGRSLSTSRKPKVVKDIRKVPAEPEKILDAPDVVDDFCKFKSYLQLPTQNVCCTVQMLIHWHGV